MKFFIRIAALGLIALSAACSGGSSGGPAGIAGFAANGDYQGIQTFLTNIRVVDLASNTPPVDADCLGDIDVTVDDVAADVITGSGSCTTSANFATYTLVGGFLNDTDFEGDLTIVFSRVTHVVPFAGSLIGNRLEASFSARTPQTGNLVIDWTGNFVATRL